MSEFLRHIEACNTSVLPGGRVRVVIEGATVGWMSPALAERVAAVGARTTAGAVEIAAAALPGMARMLAEAGAFRFRSETFDVRAEPGGRVLAQIDRGALPAFGIAAAGVHVNGLVGDQMWVAYRSASKLLDPGKLDHLVAGGVAAGDTVAGTLVKEGAEEAGVPAELMRQAVAVGTIGYAMVRQEGLRRDVLHCFDLELPAGFVPEPRDGEVDRFELWPLARVLAAVRESDAFKFNVNLVLIDLFLRRGLVVGDEAAALRAALDEGERG